MSLQMTDVQQCPVTIIETDEAGNAVEATGEFTWASDDESIVTVTSDGPTATIASTGTLGTATVTVTDVETDGDTLSGTLQVTIVPGDGTALALVPGTPVHK